MFIVDHILYENTRAVFLLGEVLFLDETSSFIKIHYKVKKTKSILLYYKWIVLTTEEVVEKVSGTNWVIKIKFKYENNLTEWKDIN